MFVSIPCVIYILSKCNLPQQKKTKNKKTKQLKLLQFTVKKTLIISEIN